MPSLNSDTNVLERVETNLSTAEPKQYDVLMYNDDVTPMDCVVIILMEAFSKDLITSIAIMMDIHQSDKGLVGTYSMDEAYSRLDIAEKLKAEMDIPLMITIEEH